MTAETTYSLRTYVLTGATAAGKKEIGLEAARRLGVEIVSMDSVKVYRGLAVGAARPNPEQAAGLRIHLMDVADPTEKYSIGRYLEDAGKVVASIRENGSLPLFLGGTPLYLQGLLRGIFPGPKASPEIRARLEDEARSEGVEVLHQRLQSLDPVAADRIQPRDFKRISRALEVYALTGCPISQLQASHTRPPIEADFTVVGLRAPSALMNRRVEERTDQMLEKGLVEEVRGLLASESLRGEAANAIGYREIVDHLAGRTTLEEARSEIIRSTRKLIRKQLKWFRRFHEINWVDREAGVSAEELTTKIVSLFRRES